jgi:hypothetical protein
LTGIISENAGGQNQERVLRLLTMSPPSGKISGVCRVVPFAAADHIQLDHKG